MRVASLLISQNPQELDWPLVAVNHRQRDEAWLVIEVIGEGPLPDLDEAIDQLVEVPVSYSYLQILEGPLTRDDRPLEWVRVADI